MATVTCGLGALLTVLSTLLQLLPVATSSRWPPPLRQGVILVDDTQGLGRAFHGIGALSGGSATSKLLADYNEPQRSQILDYLFKPQFGASLQILKVEIGGDGQASDATEASHMHNATDENYHRGYEWWLMKEAKRRNPSIILYGLPWDFPAWLGDGTRNPYTDPWRLASYIVKWVRGAKLVHGLDIDYVGIWNERDYNILYIKVLRQMLDDAGYANTRIVAADGNWNIVDDLSQDAMLDSAVDVIGVHYPGTVSPQSAVNSGKPLWSSEDYSTFNDANGGGCWARILNQNYVNGHMTSTIAWNLIDSYFQGLPWDRESLMTAREPWSGYYSVDTPIWVSAHTCQFASPGWHYLRHGYGVAMLEKGGSMVSLVSPDSKDLTIVIETMSHDHSKCIRPELPPYNVSAQNVTIALMGSFVDVFELEVWYTKLGFNGQASVTFSKLPNAKVVNGLVTLVLGVDEIFTLTTVTTGHKGDYGPPPSSAPFPKNYYAFFSDTTLNASSEAPYFSNQQGVFEIVKTGLYQGYLRQTVLEMPIPWCPSIADLNATMSIIGNAQWSDVLIRSEVLRVDKNGSAGIYLAARIDQAGCNTAKARGLFFFIYPRDQLFLLTNDLAGSEVIKGGHNTQAINTVDNTMELSISQGYVSGTINRILLFNVSIPQGTPSNGFVGLGTDSYGYADWSFVVIEASDPGRNPGHKDKGLQFRSEKGLIY